jgi:hypothetical protein
LHNVRWQCYLCTEPTIALLLVQATQEFPATGRVVKTPGGWKFLSLPEEETAKRRRRRRILRSATLSIARAPHDLGAGHDETSESDGSRCTISISNARSRSRRYPDLFFDRSSANQRDERSHGFAGRFIAQVYRET